MKCTKCGKQIRNLPDYVSEYTEVVCNDCAVTVASEDDIEAARERAMPKKRNPERQDEELPLAA